MATRLMSSRVGTSSTPRLSKSPKAPAVSRWGTNWPKGSGRAAKTSLTSWPYRGVWMAAPTASRSSWATVPAVGRGRATPSASKTPFAVAMALRVLGKPMYGAHW